MWSAGSGKAVVTQVYQPPGPGREQGGLERRGARDPLQQVRRARQQMVPAAEAPARPVPTHPLSTQTKIKNYFYGRIRFFLKLIVKIILRENTGFIGHIKTEALLDIYEAKNSTRPTIKSSRASPSSRGPSRASSTRSRRRPASGSSRTTRRNSRSLPTTSSTTTPRRAADCAWTPPPPTPARTKTTRGRILRIARWRG